MQASFPAISSVGFAPRAIAHLAARVGASWRAYRERRELAGLNDHMLRDLGLSRGDVDAATGGPLWQPVDYALLEAARRRSGPRLGAR